uniref:Uncharacterized protein n=1 Tax=Rhodnius prolixus TaxID=13249 RepID=T1HTS2_RHOPR
MGQEIKVDMFTPNAFLLVFCSFLFFSIKEGRLEPKTMGLDPAPDIEVDHSAKYTDLSGEWTADSEERRYDHPGVQSVWQPSAQHTLVQKGKKKRDRSREREICGSWNRLDHFYEVALYVALGNFLQVLCVLALKRLQKDFIFRLGPPRDRTPTVPDVTE